MGKTRMNLSVRAGLVAVCLLSPWLLEAATAGQAKYIFLLIGDGMGASHRAAAEIYLNGTNRDDSSYRKLAMNSLPVVGLSRTQSTNSWVTDSAAAGTAIATGRKTRSGAISMSADGKTSFPTIAEIAKKRGMKVGIVSNVSIDHATPASFYAHHRTRSAYNDITMQLVKSNFDYFGGGTNKNYRKSSNSRVDSVVTAARERGYTVTTGSSQFGKLKTGAGKVWARTGNAGPAGEMSYAIDRDKKALSLADFTDRGIDLLENPKGFFMMVEGGKIDWASHVQDAATVVREILAFDQAVGKALEFYRKHPEETLVIVTADHETGGMGLGNDYSGSSTRLEALTGQKVSGEAFYNKTVQKLRREKPSFSDTLAEVEKAFGLQDLGDSEKAELQDAYEATMNPGKRSAERRAKYGRYDPLTITCTRLVSRRAGIGWTSHSHTAVPVPTTAIGPGSKALGGFHDNTDIFHAVLQALPKPESAAPETNPATRTTRKAG
ncbi:MAG: alkaline phosphatase [Phycisphaerae bacterium]